MRDNAAFVVLQCLCDALVFGFAHRNRWWHWIVIGVSISLNDLLFSDLVILTNTFLKNTYWFVRFLCYWDFLQTKLLWIDNGIVVSCNIEQDLWCLKSKLTASFNSFRLYKTSCVWHCQQKWSFPDNLENKCKKTNSNLRFALGQVLIRNFCSRTFFEAVFLRGQIFFTAL